MSDSTQLQVLWNEYISCDMAVREREDQIKEADLLFKEAEKCRDAAWEKYRALKAQLGIE